MIALAEATDLITCEGLYLDRRQWDEWLALFTDDAVYWMPAWRDEATPTQDPDSELSLIYYAGKHNLEDRVWRVKSGLSVASVPLQRTAHSTTNIHVEADGNVCASFAVHCHDTRKQASHTFFGRYEYQVRQETGAWKIAKKTIILMNDRIPTVADFYML
jgi:benzoate/toluate 1,2-dioxygenase subunit beta